jgi:hypothetical protein
VRLHSVFLRSGCDLPYRFDPHMEPVSDNWNLVREIAAPAFDTMIRQAGWHFMWMVGSHTRRGFAFTREAATHRALSRALKGILRRFNGAELDTVEVTKYPGFHVAKVTLQSRQIQHQTSLQIAADTPR